MASITSDKVMVDRWPHLIELVETAEMGAAKAKRLMKLIELTDDAVEFEAVILAVEKILMGSVDKLEDIAAKYVKLAPYFRELYAERFGINNAVRIDKVERSC